MIHCTAKDCVYNKAGEECLLQDITVKGAKYEGMALCDTYLPFEETSTQTVGDLLVTVKTTRTIIEQPKENQR